MVWAWVYADGDENNFFSFIEDLLCLRIVLDFPGGSLVKRSPATAGDTGLIPGSGRSPGEGHGNPLQYFCLGNPMDRGAWWAAVKKELDMTE